MEEYPLHESMRGYFGFELWKAMKVNSDIYVILPDLGYGMFDPHREAFPERVIVMGAAEQAAVDIAIGLAMSGKIPIVYSITPFLVFRSFESIRNYINRERVPVKLIGSGRDRDYAHDGFSHWADDVPAFLSMFENIVKYYPKDKEEIEDLVSKIIDMPRPVFVGLKR